MAISVSFVVVHGHALVHVQHFNFLPRQQLC